MCLPRRQHKPFEDNLSPLPAALHQGLDVILPSEDVSICIHEISVFLCVLKPLQLFAKVVHLCRRELATNMNDEHHSKHAY